MDTLQTAALSLGLVVSAINGLSLSFTVYDMWVAQSPLQYTSQRFVVFAMDTLIGGIFAYSAGSWELGFNRTLNAVLAILYLWVFGLVLPGKGAGAELWTQVALLSATALALWQTTLAQVGWIQTANVFGSISTASGVTQAILPMVQVVRNILRPTAPDQTVNSLQPKIIKSKDARSIPLPWTIMAFCSGIVWLTWACLAGNPFTGVSCAVSLTCASIQLCLKGMYSGNAEPPAHGPPRTGEGEGHGDQLRDKKHQ